MVQMQTASASTNAPSSIELTPYERNALAFLGKHQAHGKYPPSVVGYALWELSDPETRKRNPSPQGMALFASKFLRTLREAGLASSYKGWSITGPGLDLLAHESTGKVAA